MIPARDSPPRVVITGIGVISALGGDLAALSTGLRQGLSGIGPLTLFDPNGYGSTWAGQAPTPTPEAEDPDPAPSRANLLALVAARDACSDAGLLPADGEQAALILGVGSTGNPADDRRPLPHQVLSETPASVTDTLARRLDIRGPRSTIMTACSSSATALGIGLDLLRRGRVQRVVAGGVEALARLTFGGFSALKAMDHRPCRPFHRDRAGLTLGEGAAMLVLEPAELAARRGASIYAELAGYGVSSDSYHITAPAPDGRGAVTAMVAALRDASLSPGDVDYINAHGTATPLNDAMESAAIHRVFGEARPAVSSTKAATGHALGAAGAIEAAACALALRHGFLPPTLRLDRVDPACTLDLVGPAARAIAPRAALSNSFAFGGHNTCLALRRWER